MDLTTAINGLTQALASTEEYKSLISAKSMVDSNQKLKSLISDLERKQNYLYTNNNLSENEVARLSQELRRDYDSLSQIKEARNYFSALENFDALMSRILSKVSSNLKV